MRKIALVWTGIAVMCAAGCGAPEPTATGEIERESIGADLDFDQWPWDADRVEVECWGSGAEQAHIYTIVVDRGNARHRLFSGSGSMSFNPGSALTPSHDDPLEDSVLIRRTETAPARVASTSALEPPLRTGKSSAALTCRLSSNQ